MRRGLALAAIACALPAGTAQALAQEARVERLAREAREAGEAREAQDPRHIELDWIIGPHEIPSGDFWVREMGQVVETRLLPSELYAAEGPVTAADGALLMGAGQQIVRLRARQLIACNIRRGPVGRSSVMRICLIDTDNDDRFDSYFERSTGAYYWFALSGRVPGRLKRINAPAFRVLSPGEMTDAPVLRLHYERILDGGLTIPITLNGDGKDLVRFHFRVGTVGRRELMYRNCRSPTLPSYCASSTFPSQFRFAGLTLDLLERRGEDIRVRVVTPFARVAVRLVDTQDPQENNYTAGELFVVEDQ